MAKSRARKLADIIVGAGIDIDGNLTFDGGSTSADLTFADNDKANFGDASDLQIYHDGSASYIKEAGTGDFIIQGSNTLRLQGSSSQELANFGTGGAVTLFHNNSAKFATTSSGIDVTGTAVTDGLTVAGNALINRATFSDTQSDPALEISARTDTSNLDFKFIDNDGSVLVNQVHHKSEYYSTDGTQVSAKVRTEYADVSGGMNYVISTSAAGVAVRDRLKIASSGDVSLYENTGTTAKFFWDASTERLGLGTTTPDNTFHVVAGADGEVAQFTGAIENRGLSIFVETAVDASALTRFRANSGGSAGQLAFNTDANERMRIDEDGNVGIGTTSPGHPLHVSTTDTIPLKLSGTSTSGTGIYIDNDRTGSKLFGILVGNVAAGAFSIKDEDASTTRFVIDSSGNVGIGTTAPSTALHVSAPDGNAELILQRTGATASSWGLKPYAANFYIRESGTDRVTILSGGNVGIGTTAPAAPIHIETIHEIATIVQSSHNNGTHFVIRNSDATTGRKAIINLAPANNVTGAYVGAEAMEDFSTTANRTADLFFSTRKNGTLSEKMRIDSNGDVGIGTTDPNTPLHFLKAATSSDVNYIKMQMPSWAGHTNYLKSIVWHDGSNDIAAIGAEYNGTMTNIHFHSQYNSAYKATSVRTMTIKGDGNVGIGTDSPNAKLEVRSSGTGESTGIRLTDTNGTVRGNLYFGGAQNFVIHGASGPVGADAPALQFATGGSTPAVRMTILEEGNIGIGTTNPGSIVDIRENATGGQARLRLFNTDQTNSTAQSALLFMTPDLRANGVEIKAVKENADFSAAAGRDIAITFSPVLNNAAAERMRIDSSGNVGIGNSDGTFNGTGTRKVQIETAASTSLGPELLIHNAGQGAGAQAAITFGGKRSGNEGYTASIHTTNNDGLHFGTAAATDFSALPTTRMVIDTSGNVGIGTSSFTSTASGRTVLEVNGSSASALINLSVNGTRQGYIFTDTTDMNVYNVDSGSLNFGTSNTGRMRIDSNGNVSIGTSNSLGVLTIKSTASDDQDIITITEDGTNQSFSINGNFAGLGSTGNAITLDSYWADDIIVFRGDGNVGIGTDLPAIGGGRTYDVALTIDGGVSGGVEDTGALEVGGSTSVNDRLVGSISYFNRDNSGAGATTRRQVAIIEARSVTSDSNAGDDSGADLTFSTKSEGGSVAERMRIDSSGQVGIGTSIPVRPLSVKASQEQLTLSEGDLRGATFDYRSSTGNLNIATNGINARTSPQFTLDLNGNVGIGTTSPNAKLELNVPTGDGLLIKSADISTIKMKGSGGVTDWGFATTNLAAGDFGIYASNSAGGDPITAGTAKMYFTSAGNVGIGTTSPGTPLTVNGGTESFSIEISETPRMTMGADGTWNYIKAKSGQGFRFSTTGAGDVLALTNGGNIGIGVTNPDRNLVVSKTNPGDNTTAAKITGSTSYVSNGNWEGPLELDWTQSSNDGYIRMLNIQLNDAGSNNQANYGVYVNGEDQNYFSGNLLAGITGVPTGLLLGKQLAVGSSTGAEIVAFREDTIVAVGDKAGAFLIGNSDADGAEDHFVGMWGKVSSTNGSQNLHFAAGRSGYESDSPQMTLDSSGNVGIGRTSISPPSAGATTLAIQGTDNNKAGAIRLFSANDSVAAYIYPDSVNGLSINTSTSHPMVFRTAATDRMRISSAGTVGIGVTPSDSHSATYKMQLYATSQCFMSFGNSTTGSGTLNGLIIGNDSTGADIYQREAQPLRFHTTNTERMRIDSAGTIQTRSSDGLAPTIGTGCVSIWGRSNSSSVGILRVYKTGDDGNIVDFYRTGNTLVGSISMDSSGTAYNTTSDRRLKKNIEDAEDAGQIIDSIQVRKFDWIGENIHQRYGMIAQELNTVAPEAVFVPEDEEKMQSVDYSKLIPMLVKEVQSLRARVAELEGDK